MSLEAGLVAVLVSAAVRPLAPKRLGRLGVVILLVAVFATVALALSLVPDRPVAAATLALDERPIRVDHDGYVSSDTCQACHRRAVDTWTDSYHRTMTQLATPESVVGTFPAELSYRGLTWRLDRRGDEFWVEMDDPSWYGRGPRPPRVERQIVLVTGSHHQQVYWFPTGLDRTLAHLPWTFLIDRQRWVPRVATTLDDPRVTSRFWSTTDPGAWNRTCIKCHSTHGVPKLERSGHSDTRVAEFGIACEACHGPAGEHAAANRDPRRRYLQHLSDEPDPTIVQPESLSGRRAAEICGQCHSINLLYTRDALYDWYDRGFAFRPGDTLDDTRLVARHGPEHHDETIERIDRAVDRYRAEDRFWSDGMVRVSGREYNGLIESPCYADEAFSCTSCHTMHQAEDDTRPRASWADDQLGAGMDGDTACLQCHGSIADDLERHTRHPADSSGSRCYNCHMPYTTYGLLKAIRSHEVDSPTVRASIETGRPNACNQCHLNETLDWAAGHLEDWYGTPRPPLTDEQRRVSAGVRWALAGDAGQRVLMAWSLGWDDARDTSGSSWMIPYLAQLLQDPYDAVRLVAEQSLRRHPGYETIEYDPFAAPQDRMRSQLEVLERWRLDGAGHDAAPKPALLLDEHGRLRLDPFRELLSRRDDRRVTLRE